MTSVECKKFVVYLTKYSGVDLPKWYVGSTSAVKIANGYRGSVLSKKYKTKFSEARSINPELFKTRILSFHTTRKEALEEELRVQKKHNVVMNSKYMNESYTCVNGFFGRDVSGELNPRFGKPHSKEQRQRQNMSKIAKTRTGDKNPNYGNKWTSEQKANLSELKKSKKWKEEVGRSSTIKSVITQTSKLKWFKVLNELHETVEELISAGDLRKISSLLLTSSKDEPVGFKAASKKSFVSIGKGHLVGLYAEEVFPSREDVVTYVETRYSET